MKRYPCPCCEHLTFFEPVGASYGICPVCFWEDDPVQFDDPAYRGGANSVSLDEAKLNFAEYGAVEERFIKFVRQPEPSECLSSS